jgi:hypothetical protein
MFGQMVALQWRRTVADSWWHGGVLVRDGSTTTALMEHVLDVGRGAAAVQVSGWGTDALRLVSDVCRDIDAVLRNHFAHGASGAVRHEMVCPHCVAARSSVCGSLESAFVLDAIADREMAPLRCPRVLQHRFTVADCMFYDDQLYAVSGIDGVPPLSPPPADPLSAHSSTPAHTATVQQAVAAAGLAAFTPLERIGRHSNIPGFYGTNGAVYVCKCSVDDRRYVVKIMFNNAAAAGVQTNLRLLERSTQAEHELSEAVGVSRFVYRVVAHFTERRLFGGDVALRWPEWELSDGMFPFSIFTFPFDLIIILQWSVNLRW